MRDDQGRLDAQLDLLDRQVVDSEGRMIAKVDDVELEPTFDGRLRISGLLTGPGALGPRLGGAVGSITVAAWSRLSGRDAAEPKRIDQALVEDYDTVIRLRVRRERLDVDGFESWVREQVVDAFPGAGEDPDAREGDVPPPDGTDRSRDDPPPERQRLDRLLGMTVRFADGRDGERVIDATLDRDRSALTPQLVVEGLVIGVRRPGTLFGYHRHPRQGPWMIRVIVQRLHRSTGYVPWNEVAKVDWDDRVVHLRVNDLEPLPD